MTAQVKCPTCGATIEWSEKSTYRPFCSDKCRLLDLGDWANENHTIPGRDGDAGWGDSSGNGESLN